MIIGILLAVFGGVFFVWLFSKMDYSIMEEKRKAKATKNQLSKLQHQNMRYNRELRILNKKYRRSRLLNKKFQKERDALKGHFGMKASMTVIKSLYPEGNLDHLDGE